MKRPYKKRSNWGKSQTKFYSVWERIGQRCNNPKNPRYEKYGGRGIKCEWKSFAEFENDMHKSYLEHIKKFGEKNTTIERIDNDGNYSKENCRWATWEEQARNKSNHILINFRGEIKCLAEWTRIIGFSYPAIKWRIEHGWSIKKAFTIPPVKGNNKFFKQ